MPSEAHSPSATSLLSVPSPPRPPTACSPPPSSLDTPNASGLGSSQPPRKNKSPSRSRRPATPPVARMLLSVSLGGGSRLQRRRSILAAMNGSVKVGYGTEFAEQLLMEIVQESLGQQSAKTKKTAPGSAFPSPSTSAMGRGTGDTHLPVPPGLDGCHAVSTPTCPSVTIMCSRNWAHWLIPPRSYMGRLILAPRLQFTAGGRPSMS